MASALYNSYKQDLLDRALAIDYDTNAINCVLYDVGARAFTAADDFRLDIAAAEVDVAADADFATKTVTDGVADADDLTYTAVSGVSIEALAIYRNVGTAATDDLIAFIDGFSAVTPNGGDITVTWDSGANRIFAF